MRLIELRKLLPLRNEVGEIYKWEEENVLLSPLQVQRVGYEKNLGQTVVRLVNGEQMIVEDTTKTFNRKFNEATT